MVCTKMLTDAQQWQWAIKSDVEIARDMVEGAKFFGMPAPKIALDIIEQHGVTFPKQELFNADPNCVHTVVAAEGGGVKCAKCTGWFCY